MDNVYRNIQPHSKNVPAQPPPEGKEWLVNRVDDGIYLRCEGVAVSIRSHSPGHALFRRAEAEGVKAKRLVVMQDVGWPVAAWVLRKVK